MRRASASRPGQLLAAGQVTNRPAYVAIGVTVNGERDILGLWAGDGFEGAKFWPGVLTEIKNRGVEDVCMVVCDGLKGLPVGQSRYPRSVTLGEPARRHPPYAVGGMSGRPLSGQRRRRRPGAR
jgi:hypothetical protein